MFRLLRQSESLRKITICNLNFVVVRLGNLLRMRQLTLLRQISQFWKVQKYCTKSDAPIKFSSSQARSWKAEYSRSGAPEDESAWFQPYAVTGSVAIFLIYFCVLREENDVDDLIGRSLYDRIDGLEEVQLRKVLEYNLDHGKDTAAIKQRLKELEEARNAPLK